MPRNAAKRLSNEESCLPPKFNKVRRNSSNKLQFTQQQRQQHQHQINNTFKKPQQLKEPEEVIFEVCRRKATTSRLDKTTSRFNLKSTKTTTRLVEADDDDDNEEEDRVFKNQVTANNSETLVKRKSNQVPRVYQQVEKRKKVERELEVEQSLDRLELSVDEILSTTNLKNSKATKATKQRGRRRNWRKNRIQNNSNNNKREDRSSSCCCADREATTAGGGVSKNQQRGTKEFSVCQCENVPNNNNNSNNKSINLLSAAVNAIHSNNNNNNKNSNYKNNNNNDSDSNADDDNSEATLTTIADITILSQPNCPSTSGEQQQQQQDNNNNKNFRLLSLRQRKKETDDSTISTLGVSQNRLFPHLDPEIYNRIEAYLESEEAKAGVNQPNQSKRKRFDNFPIINTRGRRAATQKYYTESAAASVVELPTIALTTTTTSPLTTTVSTGSCITATTTTTTTTSSSTSLSLTVGESSGVKRRRIMSLYDRRYQTASTSAGSSRSSQEADILGRSALITNGYLSTTRGAVVGLTGAGALTDVNEVLSDATAPPYYLAATAVASSAGSSTTNGPTLNHAPSMATLCNIGNTCYLNSVLYTLRFAPQFLHNLHHLVVDLSSVQHHLLRQRAKSASLGRGSSSATLSSGAALAENARSWSSKDLLALELNHNNNNGNGGKLGNSAKSKVNSACMLTQKTQHQLLTEKLHEVYQCLHRNEVVESTEPHHADTLLQAIQDAYVTFAGNQQQDAHEFLMCVFNSLRETSQMLIKAINECPEVLANGYIMNPDELDGLGFGGERNSDTSGSQGVLAGSSGALASATTSSSLSSSNNNNSHNITKASFFSRKSKRKEETKKTKSTRLQSPLKDAQQQQQQQQNTSSQSLFYLNAGDVNNGSDGALASTAAGLAASDEEGGKCVFTPAPVFKSKEALAAKIRELGLDFFREDFEGVTVATTKCLSCETITEQRESMIDISVPVPILGFDVSDYADKPSAFIQNSCVTREYFRGENKYRCEKCIGYTEAIRSVSYEVLPRLLVIQLSRFSGGMEKISSYVPTTFTLSCFCSKCCELSEANKLHVYKLYSVITHVGATMTVGHYIAYTCSLDWANEYMNCPKERQRAAALSANANLLQQQQQQQQQQQHQSTNGSVSSTTTAAASAASAAALAIASSGTSLMKKMKFGRSKASSSGDITKQLTKNLNGLISSSTAATTTATGTTTTTSSASNKSQHSLTNGISKLSMNSNSTTTTISGGGGSSSNSQNQSTTSTPTPVTCYSLNCCATRICSVHQMQQQLNEENFQNGHAPTTAYNSYPSGYGSTGRGSSAKSSYHMAANLSAASGSSTEPIWYMCDDDKIKAMPQREFEDILSPSRKVTITPYLLFYARFDLQPSITASAEKLSGVNKAASLSSSTTSSGGTLVSKI